ncbi:hypothetical protein [Nocardia sp. NPDC005998]
MRSNRSFSSRIDLLGTTLVATAIETTPTETVRPEADVLEQLAALAAEAG